MSKCTIPLGKEAENEIASLIEDRGYARLVRLEMSVGIVATITVLATAELNTALGDIMARHHPGAVSVSGGPGNAEVVVI